MGITYLPVTISHPVDFKRSAKLEFMVDSGAIYSVVPSEVLKSLGIVPDDEREFILANGQTMKRRLGIARFEHVGHRGGAPVIFGQKGDSTLLGATTLEAMGLLLNPIKRTLLPVPMVLG